MNSFFAVVTFLQDKTYRILANTDLAITDSPPQGWKFTTLDQADKYAKLATKQWEYPFFIMPNIPYNLALWREGSNPDLEGWGMRDTTKKFPIYLQSTVTKIDGGTSLVITDRAQLAKAYPTAKVAKTYAKKVNKLLDANFKPIKLSTIKP